MAPMQTYYVPAPTTVEYHHAVLGRIREEFDAGEHEPTNEAQEFALDRLVANGSAEVVEPTDDNDDADAEDGADDPEDD